jgi:hypothetical protein
MILTFKQYLFGSKSLLDESFKDIIKQYPHDKDTLTSYRDTLTSAGHDYSDHKLRWLYRQHLNGHLTPDHPDLHKTLETLKTHVNIHGVKDPWNKTTSFKDLHGLMKPHFGVASTKEDKLKQGRQLFYNNDDFKVYHFPNPNKEENQKEMEYWYGGHGKYPTGRNGKFMWCVTGKKDHGSNGKTYTIHHKDPDTGEEKWWAYHPETQIVTNQKNDEDMPVHKFLSKQPNSKFDSLLLKIDNFHKNNADELLRNNDYNTFKKISDHPFVKSLLNNVKSKEDIDNILSYKNDYLNSHLFYDGNLKPEHFEHILSKNDDKVTNDIIDHYHVKKLLNSSDPKTISRLLSYNNKIVNKKLLDNEHLQNHHVDELLKDKSNIKKLFINNKIKPSHVEKILQNDIGDISKPDYSGELLNHPHMETLANVKTKKDIDKVLSFKKRELINRMLESNLSSDHIDHIIKHGDLTTINGLNDHPNLQNHHIEALLKAGANLRHHPYVKSLAQSSNPKDIDKALSFNNENLNYELLKNSHLQDHHIDKLLETQNKHVARHFATSSRNIDKILSLKNSELNAELASNPKLESHHIDELLKYNNMLKHHDRVINVALSKRNDLKSHHIDKLLELDHHDVDTELVDRKDLNKQHIDTLLKKNKPMINFKLSR